MRLKHKLINWVQELFFCQLGYHRDKHSNGIKGNFFSICGKQTNAEAFKKYKVALRDEKSLVVDAVNKHHARSLVIYGDRLVMDETGKPIGEILVHPDNIESVELIPK